MRIPQAFSRHPEPRRVRASGQSPPGPCRSRSTSRNRRSSCPSTGRRGRGTPSSTSTTTRRRAAPAEESTAIVRDMDAMNMRVMVNLSGGSGETLAAGVANWKGRASRSRFVTFANLDFTGIDDAGLGRPGRRAARAGRATGRRAGPEDLQELRPDREGPAGPPRRRGRSAARSDLREVRGAVDPGAHPHRRAALLLRAAGRVQRAVAGAQAVSAARAAPGPVPDLGEGDGRAAPALREASEDAASSTRTSAGWEAISRALGKLLDALPNVYDGDRRRSGGARTPAALRARVVRQVPGPRDVREGHLGARRSTPSTSACSRPPTSTSTTTASATRSGRCTASTCRTTS